jgi:hypothetical protein
VRIGGIEFLDLLIDQASQALQVRLDAGDEIEDGFRVKGVRMLFRRHPEVPFFWLRFGYIGERSPRMKTSLDQQILYPRAMRD